MPEITGQSLAKKPIFHDDENERKRPGTTLAFAGERILDKSIGFEHLHTAFAEYIDNGGSMTEGDVRVIFMETAINAPMKFV